MHPALVELVQPSITLAYYQNVLSKFWGFHQSFEERLEQSAHYDRYLAISTPSLAHLAHDCRTQAGAALDSSFKTSLTFECEEDLWAYLYVKEGSLLGGRVIHKALSKNLKGYPSNHKFFKGHENNTGQHWKAFLEALETQTTHLDHSLICQKAEAIFNELYTWMTEQAHDQQTAA